MERYGFWLGAGIIFVMVSLVEPRMAGEGLLLDFTVGLLLVASVWLPALGGERIRRLGGSAATKLVSALRKAVTWLLAMLHKLRKVAGLWR
jgi:hypothetical protein